jgi:hypothetical protein
MGCFRVLDGTSRFSAEAATPEGATPRSKRASHNQKGASTRQSAPGKARRICDYADEDLFYLQRLQEAFGQGSARPEIATLPLPLDYMDDDDDE